MDTPAASPKPRPETMATFAHLTPDQAMETVAWVWEIICDTDGGPHQDTIDAIIGVLNKVKNSPRP